MSLFNASIRVRTAAAIACAAGWVHCSRDDRPIRVAATERTPRHPTATGFTSRPQQRPEERTTNAPPRQPLASRDHCTHFRDTQSPRRPSDSKSNREKKNQKKKTTKIARDKCTRTVSPRTRTKRPVRDSMRILFGVVYCKRKRGQLRAAVARTAFQQNTINPDENIYVHVFYFLFFPLLLFDFVRNFVCSSDRTSLSDGCARWTCSVELTWLDRTPVVESTR